MFGDAKPRLRLDPNLRPADYAPVFQRFGRLHIPGFLAPEDAAGLARAVAGSRAWRRSIRQSDDGTDLDVPLDEYMALDPARRAALELEAQTSARDAFRYMFDTVRIGQDIEAGRPVEPALAAAQTLVNSAGFLDFLRTLTGDQRIVYCDAMATRYRPGHFLTAHDDAAPGKHRLYAYVLNLTARWRADWGGLLLFLDEEDHVAEGYTPAFNALNIFRVPQRHAVSMVAPFAGEPRLSITGWVRSEMPA
ncbi:Rps23 Pro-64 3,4-dihydroxylase Tpa1-like proline 4-hydroxylase [Caulobacter ginsengisoli]|uniref:Rps23 Pro-64 3,4-dihydroxylase Tpa1-like proline 4-hydroxylase n=1 Tax=Caulobacter ginsengisoli TaxID=400775 RepID=A0ABU0IT38_9CAUL|nr:2OG-Fe(II) oxygenase family protein [Caulobacter ginsengisoli]MDQ0464132.1 Rps23 Pro-64 3,4-dihydroxylase Tpa1-like proline 4-hydroxylase [Caulobacter ginsengisoli]